MSFRFLLATFLIVIASHAYSQVRDVVIDPDNVDIDYVASAVMSGIDSIRKSSGLPAFSWNNTAGNNGDRNRRFVFPVPIQTPQNDFGKIPDYYHLNTTYRLTAREILMEILVSLKGEVLRPGPSSATLMLGYDRTLLNLDVTFGVGEQLTTGSPPIMRQLPAGEEVVIPPSRTSYSFKVKPPKDNASQRIANRWINSNREFVNGRIVTSWRRAKRMFRRFHRKSGIAFEGKHLKSYSSEQQFHHVQSRLNRRSILNENITGYISASKLLRESRKEYYSINKKKWIKIFKVIPTPFHKPPAYFLATQFASETDSVKLNNILVLRKGRLVGIIPLQPLPTHFVEVPFPTLPYTFSLIDAEAKAKTVFSNDSLRMRVNYERGEIIPSEDQIEEMIRTIPLDRKVKKISIEAYASIEGNADLNTKLFQKRSEMIREILTNEGLMSRRAVLQTKMMENWKVFDDQLRENPIPELIGKSREQIRQFINKHYQDTVIRNWLDEQRYSQVSLLLEDSASVPITADTIAIRFNKMLNKIKRKPTGTQLGQLERLQLSFYSRVIAEKQNVSEERLHIPVSAYYSALILNAMLFNRENGDVSDGELFKWIQRLGPLRETPGDVRSRMIEFNHVYVANTGLNDHRLYDDEKYYFPSYRRKVLYLRNEKNLMKEEPDDGDLDYILSENVLPFLMNRYKKNRDAAHYDSVRLFYLVTYVQANASAMLNNQRLKNSLNEIWESYIKNTTLSDERRTEWALFFNFFRRPNWSLDVLEPAVHKSDPDHFALCLSISVDAYLNGNEGVKGRLLDAADILTANEWCELVTSGKFLPSQVLEDYHVRKKYQQLLSKRTPVTE